MRESGWNVYADNPSSSAYGIPQALPGSKMASAGADWATNPVTQIRWGLGYIQDRYGSPCGAWGHSQSTAGTEPGAERGVVLRSVWNGPANAVGSRARDANSASTSRTGRDERAARARC